MNLSKIPGSQNNSIFVQIDCRLTTLNNSTINYFLWLKHTFNPALVPQIKSRLWYFGINLALTQATTACIQSIYATYIICRPPYIDIALFSLGFFYRYVIYWGTQKLIRAFLLFLHHQQGRFCVPEPISNPNR